MRKLIVLEHISLDGVIQSGGGPDEDTEGGFAYGGWSASYDDDAVSDLLQKQLSKPFDLLLGRKTFEIWEAYWPQHADAWRGVMTATKYVASNTRTSSAWQPSVFLSGDIPALVAALKQQRGPDLNVWGSANLLRTLIQHDLVDAYWLMLYPVTLGSGKRLFAQGTLPAQFKVTQSYVGASGIVVVNYERAGSVRTGRAGE